ADFVGRPLFDSLPEVKEAVHSLLNDVLNTGIPFNGTEYPIPVNRYGKFELSYFNFLYHPLKEDDGKISGIIVTVTDVSESVKAKHFITESEKQFRKMVMDSPIPMTIFRGKDYVIEIANNTMFQDIWRKNEKDVLGKKLLDVFPELKSQKYPDLLRKVYQTGELHKEIESPVYIQGDDGVKSFYLDYEYAPLFEPDGSVSGILVTVTDVTEKVEARLKLQESEKKLNIVIDASELGTWELDLKTKAVAYSDRYLEILGYAKGAVLTHEELLKRLHPDDLVIREKAFKEAFENGTLHYESRLVWEDGSIHWMEGKGKVFYDEEGKPLKMIGTIRDITDRQAREESMARMAAIVQSSSDAIISKDLNGIIASWNAGAEQIFGYTEAEMIGQPLTRLIPAERLNEESDILRRLRNGEKVDHFETKRITKDNRILDISLTISPIRGVQGNIIGASKIARNITSQKEAERLIAANEQKFRLLADSIPQFIWTGDVGGNLNYFNRALYEYSRFTPEKIAKEGWVQMVHPDDREENIRLWFESVSTGKDFLFEHRFRRHDGEYRWQLSRAVPQRDEAGNIQMWIGTSTDIQDIKEQEQQKDYFISMASHELKTPITSIKGYVQIMQEMYAESEDAFLRNSLNVMDRQIATLIKLISELLDISKIKMGSLEINKEHFEISSLINEVVDEIKHSNPGYDIPVTLGNTMVYADRHRIGQVLINFLTNAVKYAPNSKTIKIRSVVENDYVIVAVEDEGIGISKEDQEKIFERFYRAEGKNEKTYPGFGIGLFIASEIIQRHDGKIYVTSEPGKGSVFSFALPLH
ncbi:MAG TPA: PAS domain S-box protein, partial [Puia sp.]|nr:PAS domain S-box protein [Puia sp.]